MVGKYTIFNMSSKGKELATISKILNTTSKSRKILFKKIIFINMLIIEMGKFVDRTILFFYLFLVILNISSYQVKLMTKALRHMLSLDQIIEFRQWHMLISILFRTIKLLKSIKTSPPSGEVPSVWQEFKSWITAATDRMKMKDS